jgi:pyrophosphatase PpaX
MRYKGVLFDLDGTLLDTSNLIIKSFQHTIKVHYDKEVDVAVVRAYFGKPLKDAMEYLGPEKVDDLISTYREYNLLHHDELAQIFSGVVEVIQKLYDNGVKMAIVTSKTRATALRGLKLFDLDKYFAAIIGCEDCERHKPHPEPVSRAIEDLQLAASECLMVGDSPFDIVSANQAGVATAAVRWTEVPWEDVLASNPDYLLDDMYQLLDVIAGGDKLKL